MLPTELTEKVSEMLGVNILAPGYSKLLTIMDMVYESGHIVGQAEGNERVKELFNQIFITGMDTGHEKGLIKGKELGKQEGILEGIEQGKLEGFKDGFQKGKDAGLMEAIDVVNGVTLKTVINPAIFFS